MAGYGHTTASQLGQDRLVLALLNGLRGGFFIDSGASDGLRASNTLMLEQDYGWSGICIEPNDTFFAQLVRNRGCRCVNVCLYDREEEVEFVEADTLGGILSAYNPDHLAFTMRLQAKGVAGRPLTVRKPASRIASVLRDCAAPRVIDYWTLDTEGSELAILRSFPFEEYNVRVLTVEHNRYPAREEIYAFLTKHGYERVCSLGIDDCYAKGVTLPARSWRSRVWRGCR
jgi:FkbM family methyltransferase